MDKKWPREEEEYLMKVSDQCQYLSGEYNEIYNTFKIHETRFKLPVIILGSVVGMLSFGASQFGNENTDRITIGVGVSSIIISIISSIEAYLKIGETMTNSLVTATQLKKLKEKIDIELAVLPDNRTSSSTVFLRQCHCEYMDIIEKAPPLQFKGILSRLKNNIKRMATRAITTPKNTGMGVTTGTGTGTNTHETIQEKFRSIVALARNQKLKEPTTPTDGQPPSAPRMNPIRSKFQSLVSLPTESTKPGSGNADTTPNAPTPPGDGSQNV